MSVEIDNLTDEEFDKFMENAIASGELEDNSDEEVEVESDEEEVETESEEEQLDEESEEQEEDEPEEGEDATEQPEDDADVEDSDDNDDEDEDEDDTDEDSEDDTAASEDAEEDPAEVNTKSETETEAPTYKVRANGADFELTAEELVALAPKAFDYTKKMQQIKPYRELITAIEDEKLTKDDVNLLISAYKGDKDAIAEVLKKNNVDALDINTEDSNYAPKNYGRSVEELEVTDALDSIKADKEYPITSHVMNSQWDDASREMLVKQPQLITELHKDVQSGRFDKYSPLAMKKKALDGGKKSDLEYHIEAAVEYAQSEQVEVLKAKQAEEAKAEAERKAAEIEAAKEKQKKQQAIKKKATKRKAAATTKPGGGRAKVKDYLADDTLSDEEFSKLMEKQIRGGR